VRGPRGWWHLEGGHGRLTGRLRDHTESLAGQIVDEPGAHRRVVDDKVLRVSTMVRAISSKPLGLCASVPP